MQALVCMFYGLNIEKVPSRSVAQTTLERSDDGPKGEVFIKMI